MQNYFKHFFNAESWFRDRGIKTRLEVGNKVLYLKVKIWLTGYENNWREGFYSQPVRGAGRGSGANFCAYTEKWVTIGKLDVKNLSGFIEYPDGYKEYLY